MSRGEGELLVRLVGAFAVHRADRALAATEVGSRKARVLLALLAVEHGRLVPIDRIIEALWADSWPKRPVDNVATLVSRLRATLGASVVGGRRGAYRLGPGVEVDLWVGAELIDTAETRLTRGDVRPARSAAEQAMDLLDDTTVLADEPDAVWAEPARAVHTGLVRRARHALAEAALRAGDARATATTAQAAVTADPFDEVAYRALMRAHEAAGETGHALAAYQRLRGTLAEELGIDPSPTTRDLHTAILRNTAGELQ